MESRLLPLFFAGLSFLSLVPVCVVRIAGATRITTSSAHGSGSSHNASWTANIKAHARSYGGYTIFSFMLVRLMGTLALLLLSITTPGKSCQQIPNLNICVDSMSIVYAYSSFLVFILLSWRNINRRVAAHNEVLQLLVLGVYVYRDLWPLATYFLEPEDIAEGSILWAKISIIVILSVIIPLFTPNAYIPIDPQNLMHVPAREQTDPWISRLLYMYIDPIVVLANKMSHLDAQQLPPLMDVDYACYLQNQAFPHIDPFAGAKRRHLFWGLLSLFRWEYFVITICLVGAALCTYAGPIGIVNILSYLETGGEKATIKPWLWIALFFVGGSLKSLFEHWHMYLQRVVLGRIQALLTQLVFEHSLRIRLKAEIQSGESQPQGQAFHTPSVIDDELGGESSTINNKRDNRQTEGGNKTHSSSTKTISTRNIESTVNMKGKARRTSPVDTIGKTTKKDANNLVGTINNLITNDVDAIADGTNFLTFILLTPLQIILSMIFLFRVLGWSAIISFLMIFGLVPIAVFVTKKTQNLQTIKMKMTDARIQTISEAIGIIRMVKLFGWEAKMKQLIRGKREEELRWHWKIKALGVVNSGVSNFIPVFAMFMTYATYTIVIKEELNASKIFSSIAVFNILRDQIFRLALESTGIVQAKVSLDRLTNFVNETELLDQFSPPDSSNIHPPDECKHEIGFRNAMFTWSAGEGVLHNTSRSSNFVLSVNGDLLFKQNCINLIIGPTGSGKTSLLMALLGEMHFKPTHVDSWFNLPRDGGIAYATQESWVQNATVRENILCGAHYEESRYQKVIYQCALRRDLELFDASDNTEVGERGLTLSGGQKARVTLARAVYSNAKVILLDDIFAALDIHTSVWIVNNCLRGDLIKGRTVLLVTHNIELVRPIAAFVVSLGLGGDVQSQATDLSSFLEDNPHLTSEVQNEITVIEGEKEDDVPQPVTKSSSGERLIVAEEIVEGHITWKSVKLLISGLGGDHPVMFFVVLVLLMVTSSVLSTIQTWFLGVWGEQYEHHTPSQVYLSFYLLIFSLIIIGNNTVQMILLFFFNYRMVCSSRIIHSKLIDSILGSTFRWLDKTPAGRIISRCTQDIRVVDTTVASTMFWVIDMSLTCLIRFGAILLVTPLFIFPGVAVALCGVVLANWYLKAQLSIKREMSNARSPLLAHFSSALHGLVSIRAYGAQQAFRQESHKRIDHYTRIARTSWNLNRWIGTRMDILSTLFITMLAYYQVYMQKVTAANTGFSLNMAFGFCISIFYLIHSYNAFEVESNSLERIQGYLDIDNEPRPTDGGRPPASWPTSGNLRVENLSARYSPSGPNVLHNLSFHVNSGEHIGVVGRTGSGKSSLTLALLNCILTKGTIYYDGIPTHSIDLDVLRANISIIPQMPELLSGTLRQNLDPFEENDDVVLNNSLRAAGLFSLQEELGEFRLSLDSDIAGAGGNLSVGQRQIIALARAMIRGSKLLILDEATSAIDYKTDAIIQQTLRDEIGRSATVITIAHRLQTIMDADRIMVLDNGNIVEFDSPKVLLENKNGAFRALVDESRNMQ